MAKAETVEVPFTQFGNRRGFTARQLVNDPVCADFYRRFKHCFEEADFLRDITFFIESELTDGSDH